MLGWRHHLVAVIQHKVSLFALQGQHDRGIPEQIMPAHQCRIADRPLPRLKLLGDGPAGPDGPYDRLVGYRTGDMWAPKVSLGEALSVETQHFVDCILEDRESEASLDSTAQAHEICFASEISAREKRPVGLPL